MFEDFLYLLRRYGLKVSLTEWMTLMEALDKGLHNSSFTGFYYLCRCLLVKSEADFDRFDRAFLEYFKNIPFQQEVSQELLDWLNRPDTLLDHANWDEEQALKNLGLSEDEIERMLRERMAEQNEEHNGGSYWVGTQGRSAFGNSGWHPGGIRIGGESRHRTALLVAGERKFRDFRRDNTLDTRQFQMAFRLLRQMSQQADSREKVLDVDGTIRDTCDHGGTLTIRYQNPRKNAVKVLLLMDSGGSMEYYAELCSMLFQAATKSNHFKELHTYYFHNCVYEELYTKPTLFWGGGTAVPLDWVLQNYDSSYKVILVGDAAMHPYELTEPRYDWNRREYGPSGLACLERLQKRYPYLIWLNPEPMPAQPDYWGQTHWKLGHMFPMFDLSAEGLEAGMKRLMARR